jgi:hypothetical protein
MKNPQIYITEFVNSYFHICERGYHHDCVDLMLWLQVPLTSIKT